MKKYFYALGEEQLGPFTIEELKEKKITKSTLVWTEGMEEWTIASNVKELNTILIVAPPPLKKETTTPPPINKTQPKVKANTQSNNPKKKSSKGLIIGIVIVGTLAISAYIFKDQIINSNNSGSSSNKSSSSSNKSNSYEEQVKSVEALEKESPTQYLRTSGTFRENLLGGKLVINGSINSSATKATYKDPVVKVIFYSKTGTRLGSENHTVYEVIRPYDKINFKLRVTNYRDVSSVGLEVLSAKTY